MDWYLVGWHSDQRRVEPADRGSQSEYDNDLYNFDLIGCELCGDSGRFDGQRSGNGEPTSDGGNQRHGDDLKRDEHDAVRRIDGHWSLEYYFFRRFHSECSGEQPIHALGVAFDDHDLYGDGFGGRQLRGDSGGFDGWCGSNGEPASDGGNQWYGDNL